jgi:hypothetical protein
LDWKRKRVDKGVDEEIVDEVDAVDGRGRDFGFWILDWKRKMGMSAE